MATDLSFGRKPRPQLVYVRGKVCQVSGCASGLFFYSACVKCKRKVEEGGKCCKEARKQTYKRYLLRCQAADESETSVAIVAFGSCLDVSGF